MIEITAIDVIEPYILEVLFADGTRRRVDVAEALWGPLFEPVREPEYFMQGAFDPEAGTVTWPNGADLAPEYLYTHGVRIDDPVPA